ncbi:EamA family transporter [Mycolicibacterium goodii]|uniref:EamA family transporter n=1 Tax=Mycolicibacterium goodii TaxID=134601 RepID=UPI001BDCF271|nr:permease [Mycolicibacterium goodii]MBU8833669.1 permease [Mycolicibacterium goodii]
MSGHRPGRPVRGVAASLGASALFGLIFYISGVVDAPSEVVFGWRILVTFGCYAVLLPHPAARAAFAAYWTALRSARWNLGLLLGLSLLVGLQLWLFVWGPMHGHALSISLGYLLLPLVLVLAGRFVLSAPVTRAQWVAVAIAGVAVAYKISLAPVVSWTTFAVCLGYPLYFVIRRRAGLDGPAAFGVEMAVLGPVAIVLIAMADTSGVGASGYAGVAAVAFAGAAGMAAFLAASQLLALPVFGLLGYVEPVLLVGIAVLLGERMQAPDLVVYGMLAVALTILATDGYRAARRNDATTHSRSRQDEACESTTG